jgi:SM-20-related protein
MYTEMIATPIERVLPNYGKIVIFISDQFPHEVLAAERDRYSIAGWFRTDRSLF